MRQPVIPFSLLPVPSHPSLLSPVSVLQSLLPSFISLIVLFLLSYSRLTLHKRSHICCCLSPPLSSSSLSIHFFGLFRRFFQLIECACGLVLSTRTFKNMVSWVGDKGTGEGQLTMARVPGGLASAIGTAIRNRRVEMEGCVE